MARNSTTSASSRSALLSAVLGAVAALASPAVLPTAAAWAEDLLKVATGAPLNWENQPAQMGADHGIFKQHGLALDVLTTESSGETFQAVLSGSIDIGVGPGTYGTMAAFLKGAPVRIIGNQTIGADDLFWYVPANSPIKSLKDAGGKTIAMSSAGSSTSATVLGLLKEFKVAAVPTATGSPASTFTQTMSGQIDIGWSSPPLGIEALEQGRIRVLARGSDVPTLRNQMVRVIVVNANTLARNRDAFRRFVEAYRETIDWMYTEDTALEIYARLTKVSLPVARRSRDEFHPKEALRVERFSGIEEAMADAMALKFLTRPLTKAELDELFQYPMPPQP